MKSRLVWFVAFYFAFSIPVSAQPPAEWATQHLTACVESNKLAGMTAAIAVDGEIVWSDGAGFADIANQIPAEPHMVHRIASISKAMTAVAIMQLVAQEKIGLNEPLQTYLPGFPRSEKGPLTIHHLLTHTSGIRHYRASEIKPMSHYDTLSAALEVFKNDPIAFTPGSTYKYTTYGYTTLGAVIEAASGMTYAEYMRERVWLPAGMNSTSLEEKGVSVANKSKLYRPTKDGGIEEDVYDDLSVKHPGGGIQSTAADLVRFAIAFENGTLLDEAHREMMFNAPKVRGRQEGFLYGYGWIYGENDGVGRYIRHDGGQSGTSTNLMILRDHKIAVAVIANMDDESRPVQQLTVELANRALESKE